ncbi:unnamed protein product, partial [marine sediment metagenome]
RGGKMAYQDIGQQVSGNLWTEGRLIDKAEMLGNFMTNLIEEKLTGISIIAARHHGESLGFKGMELDEFASKGGAKTQSMYNFEDLPGVLRSKTIGSLFPFQTFCFQAMNFVRELVGIRVFRAGAKTQSMYNFEDLPVYGSIYHHIDNHYRNKKLHHHLGSARYRS